jgi:phage terminase large subunit
MIAEFPEAFAFLFDPARYKVAYGGRGSGKSWAVARALLIQGAQRPLRVLCARETQKSIADSVHRLLSDQVEALGLQGCYAIEKARITGSNGTEFIFAGLKHNVAGLKSYEAVDICWVEEAQSVSKGSWATLIPTIRKEKSEIWASFNPDLEQDATYQLFVVNPPPGAVVRKVNYTDNPFFPEVLRREAEHLKETNLDEYLHVWEGNCISVLEGAIYANELRQVDKEQRITRVPYDATRPVHTFWDIGYGDSTAIWFAQAGAFEYRLIDYLECNRQPLAWYLKALQERPYVYGAHYLPWDARPKQFGSGRSVEELMRESGFNVEIVSKLSVADGINAARTIFPQCYFDGEKCADGLQALRHYRYGEIATLGVPTREPLHDAYSHGADAFRYFAVGIRQPDLKPKQDEILGDFGEFGSSGAWMT